LGWKSFKKGIKLKVKASADRTKKRSDRKHGISASGMEKLKETSKSRDEHLKSQGKAKIDPRTNKPITLKSLWKEMKRRKDMAKDPIPVIKVPFSIKQARLDLKKKQDDAIDHVTSDAQNKAYRQFYWTKAVQADLTASAYGKQAGHKETGLRFHKLALKGEEVKADNDQVSNAKIIAATAELVLIRAQYPYQSKSKKSESRTRIKALQALIKFEQGRQAKEETAVQVRKDTISRYERDIDVLEKKEAQWQRKAEYFNKKRSDMKAKSHNHNPFGWGSVDSDSGSPVPGSKPGSGIPHHSGGGGGIPV